MIVMERIALVSRSQGERGQYGGQKKYTIEVIGDNRVLMRWGKAELGEWTYQSRAVQFDTESKARAFATEQMYKKMDKGYERIDD